MGCSPPAANSVQRAAGQADWGVIDEVAGFNYFYLFWVFLFHSVMPDTSPSHPPTHPQPPNLSDRNLQTCVSSCLYLKLITIYVFKRRCTEKKSSFRGNCTRWPVLNSLIQCPQFYWLVIDYNRLIPVQPDDQYIHNQLFITVHFDQIFFSHCEKWSSGAY